MHKPSRPMRAAFAAALLAVSLTLAGCIPPALTKAELDAKRLPVHHKKLTAVQRADCRSCHREQPPIRNP